MIRDNIQKAIDLVKKTGDKIILFERETSSGLVLMSFDEYESLIAGKKDQQFTDIDTDPDRKIGSLTEDELIDKINQNIAIWKNENQNRQLDEFKVIESFLSDATENVLEEGEEEEEDNLYYYGEDNLFYPQANETVSKNDFLDQQEQDSGKEENPKDRKEEVKKHWNIPVNIKKRAEEVQEDGE